MIPSVEYGVITEQGDLGLGFDPLNKEDNNTVAKAERKKKASKEKVTEPKNDAE